MKRALLVPLLASCSAVHEPPPVDPVDPIDPPITQPDITAPPDQVVPRVESSLEACLVAGGELVEVDSVFNNDREDHGELLTFGISNGGLLAAAGADGTLKFWTLDAELLATVDGSVLTYGSEEGRTPITDLAFDGETVLAGDVRGLVAQMTSDGGFGPVGGTTPDVPIRSVAFHGATGRLAHAQVGDVMPLVVRKLDGSASWDIEATLDDPRDLGFASTGELFVAGAHGSRASIEVRSAADPAVIVGEHTFYPDAPVREIAFARNAARGAAVSEQALYLIDGLDVFQRQDHDATSVDLSPNGDFIFTTGPEGALTALAADDGRTITEVAVDDPITVRVDATGTLVIVGSRDAMIHVFSCTND